MRATCSSGSRSSPSKIFAPDSVISLASWRVSFASKDLGPRLKPSSSESSSSSWAVCAEAWYRIDAIFNISLTASPSLA